MNAYATVEILSHTAVSNGRAVYQAVVDMGSFSGDWLGSFKVFGLTKQEVQDRAYYQAEVNLNSKGFSLQYRVAL